MRGKGDRMLLWVSVRYQWSESGKQQYARDLLLLQNFKRILKLLGSMLSVLVSVLGGIGKAIPGRFIGDDRNGVEM